MVSHFRSRAKLLGIYFHATGSSGFFAVAALMQEARGCINASAWKRDIKRVSHLNLYAGLSVESIAMSIVERNLLLLPAALTNIDALFCAASGAGERKQDDLIHRRLHWHFYYNNVHSPYVRKNLSLLWLWNFLFMRGKWEARCAVILFRNDLSVRGKWEQH